MDSVFSIGASYGAITAVVKSVATDFGISAPAVSATDDDPVPPDRFLYRFPTSEALAAVVRNRQPTSTRNGTPKTEATLRYAAILADDGVTTLVQARTLLAATDRLARGESALGVETGEVAYSTVACCRRCRGTTEFVTYRLQATAAP